jgi:tRNA pseudouridine13 synthase
VKVTLDPLAPLALVTAGLPGIGGRIKVRHEDFEVEEIPAYQPSGQGDFLYLWVEKRDMGGEYFARQVARRLDIPTAEVGTAGLKDRHAVTRQWVSVPGRCELNLAQLDGDGIRVLAASRHTNKLKPGHLHGNRFRILIRDVEPDAEQRLLALLDAIRQGGMPNFYGAQRFGRDGETFRIGMDLLTGQGRKVSPFLRKFALSAVQSALFNRCVASRIQDGLLRRVLAGDVMAKWPYGGLFVAEDLPREQARLEAHEIIPAGPMFGKKLFAARDEAASREAAVLQEADLKTASFHGFGKLLAGTRRYLYVWVDDLAAAVEPEGVRLTCTLPAGSYATVFIRELTHREQAEGEDSD